MGVKTFSFEALTENRSKMASSNRCIASNSGAQANVATKALPRFSPSLPVPAMNRISRTYQAASQGNSSCIRSQNRIERDASSATVVISLNPASHSVARLLARASEAASPTNSRSRASRDFLSYSNRGVKASTTRSARTSFG